MTQTIVVQAPANAVDPDDLLVSVDGRQISGWTSSRVTRGIERCPNDFEVTLTELYPTEKDALLIRPGDPCEVFLGRDRVITGYVDRYSGSISEGYHEIRISGRGMCQDLVDCAAEWPGNVIVSSSVLQVAQRLAEPYGIEVRGASGPAVGSGKLFPFFVVMIGETAWSVIERLCRVASLLAYEQGDGSLFLTQGVVSLAAGQQPLVQDPSTASNALLQGIDSPYPNGVAASGFQEGVNVLSAEVTLSMDQRFSDYAAYLWNFDPFQELAGFPNYIGSATDAGVTRRRKHVTLVEHGKDMPLARAIDRAEWEAARRWGRAHELRIVTDSWRDSAGKLYTPNTLVPLDLPSLKVSGVQWLISEVTYMKDDGGTRAELLLMPSQAFRLQPVAPEYALPAETFTVPRGSARP